jgi:hypothetical protein
LTQAIPIQTDFKPAQIETVECDGRGGGPDLVILQVTRDFLELVQESQEIAEYFRLSCQRFAQRATPQLRGQRRQAHLARIGRTSQVFPDGHRGVIPAALPDNLGAPSNRQQFFPSPRWQLPFSFAPTHQQALMDLSGCSH